MFGIGAVELGLLATSGVSTVLDITSQKGNYEMQKMQLQNQKIQQENAAIYAGTQRTEQMARAISAQHAVAAASGSLVSSGARSTLFQETNNGLKDVHQIESNLASKNAKNEIQQASLANKDKIETLGKALGFAFNMFDSYYVSKPKSK